MTYDFLAYPLLVQILIPLALYVVLAVRKKQAAQNQQVNEARRALYEDAWPATVQQVNNCIRNQFELPMLFFVLLLLQMALQVSHVLMGLLAAMFVASRIAHAYIHVTSNHVATRRKVFSLGVFLVVVQLIGVLILMGFRS